MGFNSAFKGLKLLKTPGTGARLLRSWVRIPPGAWIFVCCECRVLSGRGLCDELITRPEESYRLCYVVVCDLETSRMGAPYIYIYDSRLRVKHAAHCPFFSTKCRLFQNATFFGSCIIHILHTGCAKI